MSYVDQGMSRNRVYAVIAVAILHALLAYAFVTGLAYKFVKNVSEDLKTFDVTEEPPPPPDEPPPPEPAAAPPIVAPPAIVRTNTPAPVVQTVQFAPPVQITPTAPPAPPAPPPPPRTVEPARARANLSSYVSNDDYPPSALRANEEGTTGFRLTVGPDGRVTACTVTSSSGSTALDNTTCRLMRSRARFTPARDNNNQPTTDSASGRIRWQIQDE
jgi:periplasmic protein TonB